MGKVKQECTQELNTEENIHLQTHASDSQDFGSDVLNPSKLD